jgi:hypothetical protein
MNHISLVKAVDPLAGEVLHLNDQVYKPIPGLVVFGQLAIVAFWVGLMVLGIILLIITLLFLLLGKGSWEVFKMQIWPSITTLLFILGTILFINGHDYHLSAMASPSAISASILIISVLFAVCALWSLLVIVKRRSQKIGRLVYWPVAFLTGIHVLVLVYLVWFRVIPLITWA